MSDVEVGQVVVKLNGRFAGYPAVILEKSEEGFVKIGIILKGGVLKEKKSNIKHIAPLPYKIDESKVKDVKKIINTIKEIEWGKRIKI